MKPNLSKQEATVLRFRQRGHRDRPTEILDGEIGQNNRKKIVALGNYSNKNNNNLLEPEYTE